MRRAHTLLLIGTCVIVCAAVQSQESRATRVLFIGNSYTYFNDLPEIFANLAEAGLQRKLQVRMAAPGGWRLKDHWDKGTARKLLEDERWDFVVLQDQSTLGTSYWVNGKDHVWDDSRFRPYAEKWAAAVHAKHATPVFFLTWAGKNAPEDQATLNFAYVRAAKDTESVVAPVGLAWDAVRREQPSFNLFYEGHGNHPSAAGSYLAACVFYATIFHQSPIGLPSKITGAPVNLDTEKRESDKTATLVELTKDEGELLQREAWSIWQQIANHGGYPDVLPPHLPSIETLPTGVALSESALEGVWGGTILFYPVGPVDMLLHIKNVTGSRAELEFRYHSKDFPDESIELGDFATQGSRVSFSDPKSAGVDNLAVHMTGIMPRNGELQGTAEASRENADSHIRLIGSWFMKKQ